MTEKITASKKSREKTELETGRKYRQVLANEYEIKLIRFWLKSIRDDENVA